MLVAGLGGYNVTKTGFLVVYLIGPAKQFLLALNCNYFLIHQFKHVFWVLKKTSHGDGSFDYPQRMFWLRNNFCLI